MYEIVIEGKKKSDFGILIAMAKKLGLKVYSLKEESTEFPNAETIEAIVDARSGKGTKAKNVEDLMDKLNA